MRIRLRFFGLLRERLGSEATRSLDDGTSVGTVWKAIVAETPDVRQVPVRFAVNGEYVSPEHRLDEDDELACFPPVSGGG